MNKDNSAQIGSARAIPTAVKGFQPAAYEIASSHPGELDQLAESAAVFPVPVPPPAASRKPRSYSSRPPWERMLRIHDCIRRGRYPNCVAMAAEFEVSPRTLKRDVEFMRDRLCLPIEYDRRRHGFFYSGPVEGLPELPFSEADLLALGLAQKAIAQYPGTPFVRLLRQTLHKLARQFGLPETPPVHSLPELVSFRPFAPETADLQAFQAVSQAVADRRELRFSYQKPGAPEARLRHVRPYHLSCIENQWYLFAYDLERRALRTFALARMTAPALTAQRFAPPQDFDPDQYLRGSFSVLKGAEDYEVVIEFDPWATDYLRRRQWHASQQLQILPRSGSRLSLRLTGLEEIEGWILSWGAHARVLRPRRLAEMVQATALAVAAAYS
jgi:predicted DNA-binding transcriptional regulator YafY